MLEHKPWVLPDIDLSHDEGDPRWHADGATTPLRNATGEVYAYRWNGLEPGHYASYWQLCVVDAWTEKVRRFETDPQDVYAAYWYIDAHPAFWAFHKPLYPDYPDNHVSRLDHGDAWQRGVNLIAPYKVNPVTRHIDEDETLNTQLEWWYEICPRNLAQGWAWHDYTLDGGTATFEGAVLDIARKVHESYGNDRTVIDSPQWQGSPG